MFGLQEVWVLNACSLKPNSCSYSVGVFTTRERAMAVFETLPQGNVYTLFKFPLDQFVGHINKVGDLRDGLGRLWHEHLTPELLD